jgi:hypothetical protein
MVMCGLLRWHPREAPPKVQGRYGEVATHTHLSRALVLGLEANHRPGEM